MLSPTLRRATPADAAAVARVQVDGWRAAYAGLMPDTLLARLSVADRTARWTRILTSPDSPLHRTFVAEAGEGILGFASIGTARDPDLDSAAAAELYAIYVHPAAIRRGIGRALFERARGEIRDHGYRRMTLWVLAGNAPAIRFYEAMGLSADGAEKIEIEDGVELPHVRYGGEVGGEERE